MKILQLEKNELDGLVLQGKIISASEGDKNYYSREDVESLRESAMEDDTMVISKKKHQNTIRRLKKLYKDRLRND